MNSRQAQVENGCEEEEEDYPQEEQMDAEESTETRKPSKFASFSSILVSEKYIMFKYINQMLFAYQFYIVWSLK